MKARYDSWTSCEGPKLWVKRMARISMASHEDTGNRALSERNLLAIQMAIPAKRRYDRSPIASAK